MFSLLLCIPYMSEGRRTGPKVRDVDFQDSQFYVLFPRCRFIIV